MAPFNPFYYVAIPFSYLWNLLKENDTKRGQLFSLLVGTIIFLFGVWILWQWNSIPKYYHDLSVERFCSKDSFDFIQTSMSFHLEIDNGSGFSNKMDNGSGLSNNQRSFNKVSETFSFCTYNSSSNKKRESNYFYVKKRPYLVDYTPFIGEENMAILNNECSKSGINNADFDYIFRVCHCFSKLDADFIESQKVKSEKEYSSYLLHDIQYLMLWNVFSNDLLSVTNEGPRYLGGGNQYNYVTGYVFASSDIPAVSFTAKSKTIDRPKILNQILHFFALRDISHAYYSMKFDNISIDSLHYTISFKEAVKFSNSSVEPEKTTLNSITFSEKPYKDITYKTGVNFYVEFIESSNIQNIRIILLTALLALPLGMIVKNGWAYFTSVNAPQSKNQRKGKSKKKSK